MPKKKLRRTVVCGCGLQLRFVVSGLYLWFCGLIIIPTLVSTSTSTLTRVWQFQLNSVHFGCPDEHILNATVYVKHRSPTAGIKTRN